MEIKDKRRIYTADDTEAVFPLGGIGTGTVSLTSRGRLQDFELFNKPDKNNEQPYTFFALHHCGRNTGVKHTKILEAELREPYSHSHGFHAWNFMGAPRFEDSRFTVEYPVAHLELIDEEIPLAVSLEAYSPFVPLDAEKSGIPGIYFTWKVENKSNEEQEVCIALSAANLAGWVNKRDVFSKGLYHTGSRNILHEDDDFTAILMHNEEIAHTSSDYTEMAIAVHAREGQSIQSKEKWQEGQWWDGMQDFWNDFSEEGIVQSSDDLVQETRAVHHSPFTIGSLALDASIDPGECEYFTFVYTWYHPNRIKSWPQNLPARDTVQDGPDSLVSNYYARWGRPVEVIRHLLADEGFYEQVAKDFITAWYDSDVAEPILDAVAANLTTIRSQTCFRVDDGKFFAWEGCFDFEGSCPGNCTHVWNYAQTLAYFFPELERSMRETEYFEELRDNGKMNFRALNYLDGFSDDYHPASDGQLGSIARVYREWCISGDDAWLKSIWPQVKRSLEFAKNTWDLDQDGVLEAMQHNTYDIEFYGISTLANSIWLTALKAIEEMAKCLDELELASWASETEKTCAAVLDKECFNGEYYRQNIDDVNAHKYQYGEGLLADQLLGVTWAEQLGLDVSLLDENVKSAVKAIYQYNIPNKMRDVANLQRTYAINDEQGLVLCAWPHGGKPRIPFVYSDEVWPGVEYSVASLLISKGFYEEGERLVSIVRSRFNGKNRNPWNEPECGHHYARSLASFGPYLAYTGMQVKMQDNRIRLSPKASGRYFVICAKGWGTVDFDLENKSIELNNYYGDLDQVKFVVG